MISFHTGHGCFNFRSAAIIIHDKHILIHRTATDDFWALPGGRVELFETSAETVVREIQEELGLQSTVERQLWQVESFYEYNAKQYHELAHYFLVSLTEHTVIKPNTEFKGFETSVDLIFCWVPLETIEHYNLKPDCLCDRLNDLPHSIDTVIVNELII